MSDHEQVNEGLKKRNVVTHEKKPAKGHSKKQSTAYSNAGITSDSWKYALAQTVVMGIVFFFLTSYLVTDSWLWGYQGKYANWRRYIPRKQLVLTPEELSQYDGSDPSKNIYLAVKGEVFDVTAGRPYYSRGGGYGFFSGKDASRAYSTGCFQTHLTHDLRGLTKQQLEAVDGWAKFYRDHPKYFKVGTVILDPIDPSTPIPADCNKPVAAKPAP